MAEILDRAISSSQLEQSLAGLGMDTAPKRAIVGYAVGTALVWAIRPDVCFDANGDPKPWVLLGQQTGSDATSLPWWGLAAIPAVIFSVFI
jgi:hypothetical protein